MTVYIIEVSFFNHLQAIPSMAGNGRESTFAAEWVMLEVDGGFEPLGSLNFDAMLLD